jgi:small subunit ribosomal protein S21
VKQPTPGGGEIVMTEVRVRKGEPIEKVLRKLKKKLDKEGTLKDLRNRRYYEKPSEAKRRSRKRVASR